MEINKINGYTRTLGAPLDWDQSKGECVGLPIIDSTTENGPAMISEWQPEAEDLKLLNMGMPIHLWVFSEAHPVVSVTVGQPTQEAIDRIATDPQLTNAQLHGCKYKGWQCFHCGEIFETVGAASDHFGSDPTKEPGCAIKVKYGDERGLEMELRKVEKERDALRYQISNESTPAELKMQSMQSQHQIDLRHEEEKGYALGLADGLKIPEQVRAAIDELVRIASTKAAGWAPVETVKTWLEKLDQGLTTRPIVSVGRLTMTMHTNTAHLRRTVTDLIACDAYAITFQSLGQYRSALMKQIDQALADSCNIDNDVALMPRELSAENGAKAAMIGDFHEELELTCQYCDEDEECELCDGTRTHIQKVPVSWTTIKSIYKKAIEVCEVKSISGR